MKKIINIVFVKHNSNKTYLFALPNDVVIKEGKKVFCNTMRGKDIATAVSNSFYCFEEQLINIVKGVGAYLPLKEITGFAVPSSNFIEVPFDNQDCPF